MGHIDYFGYAVDKAREHSAQYIGRCNFCHKTAPACTCQSFDETELEREEEFRIADSVSDQMQSVPAMAQAVYRGTEDLAFLEHIARIVHATYNMDDIERQRACNDLVAEVKRQARLVASKE